MLSFTDPFVVMYPSVNTDLQDNSFEEKRALSAVIQTQIVSGCNFMSAIYASAKSFLATAGLLKNHDVRVFLAGGAVRNWAHDMRANDFDFYVSLSTLPGQDESVVMNSRYALSAMAETVSAIIGHPPFTQMDMQAQLTLKSDNGCDPLLRVRASDFAVPGIDIIFTMDENPLARFTDSISKTCIVHGHHLIPGRPQYERLSTDAYRESYKSKVIYIKNKNPALLDEKQLMRQTSRKNKLTYFAEYNNYSIVELEDNSIDTYSIDYQET